MQREIFGFYYDILLHFWTLFLAMDNHLLERPGPLNQDLKVEFTSKKPPPLVLKSTQNQMNHSDNSNSILRIIFIVMGLIGCILTAPLLLLGGFAGVFTGLLAKADLFESGLLGADIGSLGALFAIRWGLSSGTKIRALNNVERSDAEEQQDEVLTLDKEKKTKEGATQHSIPVIDSQKVLPLKEITHPAGVIPSVKRTTSELHRTTMAVDFNNPEEIKAFVKKVKETASREEAQAIRPKISQSSAVKEPYIITLISIMKDRTATSYDFWGRLEQMTDKDITVFVSKLSITKESKLSITKESKFSSSELDYLWRRFHGAEFELSEREKKQNVLAVVFSALSKNQLAASFNSADFLKIFNYSEYVDIAVNTMTASQLELFAADKQRHEQLGSMLKKLKLDAFALGKLIAIMPVATKRIEVALREQLSYLPHPPSFKLELCRLAEYYIKNNAPKMLSHGSLGALDIKTERPLRKWATVTVKTWPVYATQSVKKEEWSEEFFEAFIQQLNASSFLMNAQKIIDGLDNISDAHLKSLVEKSVSPDLNDLLNHLWIIESKPNNHASCIAARKHRLKIVLKHLNEEQLKGAVAENKFWDIFRNNQQPHGKMAAGVLTPQQFKTIAANATLDRHSDLAVLILHIKKDTPEQKQKLINIIKELLPYTTPWLVFALELKIKDLLIIDKELFHECTTALKMHLSQSVQREDVSLKYRLNNTLDKKAISNLLVTTEPQLEEEPLATLSI